MRSSRTRQLAFVFADSPSGGGGKQRTGGPVGRDFLLHRAKPRKASVPDTQAATEERPSLRAVATERNLATALLHVSRNKGAGGVDGQSVAEAVAESHRLVPRLRHALLEGSYRPGDIRRVWIPKPGGGQRGLGIPNVVDRVVQQATLQVLDPVFDEHFHESSHGFRRGKGALTAIEEAKQHLRNGRTWVVSIDLSKFFDRVNHQRLLARLSQRVQDGELLKLVHRMLTAAVVMPDGTITTTEEGTPQGGPLSPLLSNIVLDELDWELERRGLSFVRYADDFNVYVGSERAALRVMSSLTHYIESRLRLKVNRAKSSVGRPEQVHFLGFVLHRPTESGHVATGLSERTMANLSRKTRALTPRNWGKPLKACFERLNRYIRGWSGYFWACSAENVERLLKWTDAHIRRRIRAIIVKQRKNRRNLIRLLVSRGISRGAASNSANSGRVWRQSHSWAVNRAFKNKWFHERLESLWSNWKRLNGYDEDEVHTGQRSLPGLGILC